ncbi:hypothetical protein SY88_08595 [Clostridiales bacterium PH28_bin88]|nr:hypothetical protein SY88_08595 [Clostridiales bacterium PH28_bin88]
MTITTDSLVERVVTEVLRRLLDLHPEALRACRANSQKEGPARVLVVLTGGTIGFGVALEELARLKVERPGGVEYDLILSRSAAKINNPQEIKSRLGARYLLVEGDDDLTNLPSPGEILRKADLVAVPVLTRNTAAHAAALLTDTLASLLIIDGLMCGKPVVAVRNAADPSDPAWARMGMGNSSPGLCEGFLANLKRLENYGVELVQAAELAKAVAQKLAGNPPEKAAPGRAPGAREVQSQVSEKDGGNRWRPVFTRADITNLARDNGVLRLPKGAMLTPLAVDAIRELGLTVAED